jgi:glycosyltransferase involved in cell wall biosynthesis
LQNATATQEDKFGCACRPFGRQAEHLIEKQRATTEMFSILNTQPLENQERHPKPKLVRIIARLNVGGPARQACLLHERLAPFFDCSLVIGNLADSEQDMSYLLSSERNVICLPMMSREVRWWSDALAFLRIMKLLRKQRPDIVHTHTAKAGALGRAAAWLARVPVIVHTYHGHVFQSYFGSWKTRFYMTIERVLCRLTTRVIAISESQARDLSNTYRIVDSNKISVIHNGFDLEQFSQAAKTSAREKLGLGTNDFVVAWVGRMVPVKDVELLNEVIVRASKKSTRIRFLIVGDGSDRGKLKCLGETGIGVQWLGWRRDIHTIWDAADVALLTSRNEGTPTALIESMAAGTPFVATNVGGVRDLAVGQLETLPEGFGFQATNGFLTSQKPEALVHCLEKLEQNPNLQRQMGEAGKIFACRQFSRERLIADMTSLYDHLMSQAGRAASHSSQDWEGNSSRAANTL